MVSKYTLLILKETRTLKEMSFPGTGIGKHKMRFNILFFWGVLFLRNKIDEHRGRKGNIKEDKDREGGKP